MHEEWLKVAQRKTTLDAEAISAVREQAWNDIIRKYLLEINYDDLGIIVSEEEVEDMLWGNHLHDIIKQNFTNPQTNMLDTAFVQNYFLNADQDGTGQQLFVVNYLKSMINQDRLNKKYNNALSKGLYVPTFIAIDDYIGKNHKVNFIQVVRNFKEIPDESIKINDSDVEDYYNKYIERFQVEEDNRDIEYVIFDVLPSSQDTLNVLKSIEQLQAQFKTTETPKVFVNQHSDIAYKESFFKRETLIPELAENFFDSEIGTVSPVFFDNGSYKISRLLDRKIMPDSVQASHILIMPDSLTTIDEANQTIDSLKQLIDRGADFESLAMEFSQDPGSKTKGGDLGWFSYGMMVKEFNDACFNNETNDVIKVETQYGVHLIKITNQSEYAEMISLATIAKEINYSTETYQQRFAEASTFAGENNTSSSFEKAIVEKQLVKRIASSVKENDQEIHGLEYPRAIIRWAYDKKTETGDISNVFEIDDMFIVAKLSVIREKGNADIEDVREQIEPIVLKKKKAEMMIAECNADLKQGMSLEQIAMKYNTMVDTARNISFNTFSLPRNGIEPNVIATSVYLPKDNISKPIEGNNGVYIIKVIEEVNAPEKDDYRSDQLMLITSLSSRAAYQAYEAMKKKADIEDYRSTWF
jgi:peptidyl-prolyl cis-trans isomerase D